MQGFEASLPPPKHKRSTDEVFSEPQRLHKVLASCGFGSRRAMEDLILAGRITVNRMPADIGQKVGPGDEVRINGEPVKIRFTEPKARVLAYHKPTGEVVTRDDPEERATVFDQLPAIADGRWIAVGRLDFNTEGLLLFTNSGELANRLMHPRYEVEREYAVRIMGRLSDEQIRELTHGVELEDGPAKCEKVEDAGGDEDASNHWYKIVIKEGRNREVRRLFEVLGLTVSRLLRTRYGRVSMPPPLKRGEVMELDPQEVNALLRFAGLKPVAGPGGAQAGGGEPRQPGEPRPQGQGQGRHKQRRGGGQGGGRPAHGGGGQGQHATRRDRRDRGRRSPATARASASAIASAGARPAASRACRAIGSRACMVTGSRACGVTGSRACTVTGSRAVRDRSRARSTATSRRARRTATSRPREDRGNVAPRAHGHPRPHANPNANPGAQPGAEGGAGKRKRRRGRGGRGKGAAPGAPAPTQKWVGLPRDED